jgi:hypothetical protein
MLKYAAILFVVLFVQPQVSNTIVWLNYTLNKAAITKQYCENKAKPELHCNGKCHLAKQLTAPVQPIGNQAEVIFIAQMQLFFQADEIVDATVCSHALANYRSCTMLLEAHPAAIDEPPRE